MKKAIRFLFAMILIFSWSKSSAQINIKITDCNTVLAQLDIDYGQTAYTYWLEKQIAPGVWSEQKKRQQAEKQMEYPDLEAGIYRVGTVLQVLSKKDKRVKAVTPRKLLSKSFEIVLDCLPGKKENRINPAVRIYPNPSKGELRLSIPDFDPELHTVLSLFEASGKLLQQIQLSAPEHLIDLGAFNPGILFIQVVSDGRPVLYTKIALIE